MTTTLKDPFFRKTLKSVLEALFERYGWEELAKRININCFKKDPSINSSLIFLRKTPWAREKVEALYLRTFHKMDSAKVNDSPINLS